MLKTLLKKQFIEVFRGYVYDSKKKKARSKGSTIGMIILFVFLLVGVIGGTFAALSISLSQALCTNGVGLNWLFFVIIGSIAILLGVFGSVFSTYNSLYIARDNDLLLSMPIPVKYIIASRVLNVLLMGVIYSSVVYVPSLVVYWIIADFSLKSVIGGVVLLVDIAVTDLVFSCLLGWVVAKISLKLKNKSIIVAILVAVLIGLYYVFYFRVQSAIRDLITNAAIYGNKITGWTYRLLQWGRIGSGDAVAIIISLAVSAICLFLVWLILSRSFIKLATATGAGAKYEYKEKTAKSRSISKTLLSKEFSRFLASSTYMLNCGLGIVIVPIAGIALLIKRSSISEVSGLLNDLMGHCFPILIVAIIWLMASLIDTAAPSVSLEGKNIWILQSLPVSPWEIIKAKIKVQLILSGVSVLVGYIFCAAVFPFSLSEKVMMLVLSAVYVVFLALFGMFLGLKMPNLTWTNEVQPIKQSASVAIALFGGWGIAIAFGGLYFLVGWFIGAMAYMIITAVIILAVSVILYRWLKTNGTKIFATL